MVDANRVIRGRWACISSLFIICGSGFAQPIPALPGRGHPLFPYTMQRADWVFTEFVTGQMTDLDIGDLDGDGDLDVVCAGSINQVHRREISYITVFINRGNGVFEPAVGYLAGLEATAIKLADMDGDGNLDAVVANAYDDTVSVFPGLGDGTFGEHVDIAVGDEPRAIIVGDFDSDGDIDAATINTMSDDASILLNDGTGALTLAQSVPIGEITPRGLGHRGFPYPGPWHAIGDIDGDGDLDLAIPARGRIKFMLNDGDGAFALAKDSVVTPSPWAYALALEDLDGDGDLDLATIDSGSGTSTMDTWRNDGTGAFEHIGSYDSSFDKFFGVWFNTGIAFGDIDHDGDLDAAIATENGEGAVIHRNNGDGSFGPMEVLPNEWGPWAIVLADVNGDGWVDHLSLSADLTPSMHARFNDRAGNIQGFTPAIDDLFESLRDGSVGDIDGDGDLDAVFLDSPSRSDPSVWVFANEGQGSFLLSSTLDFTPLIHWQRDRGIEPRVSRAELVDLDRDGDLDLLAVVHIFAQNEENPGGMWLLFNDGLGRFSSESVLRFADFYPIAMNVADLDGDGDDDAIVCGFTPRDADEPFDPIDTRVVILLGDGQGGLSVGGDYSLETLNPPFVRCAVKTADLDSDGDLDIIATSIASRESSAIFTLINDGDGNFTIDQRLTTSNQGEYVEVGDWDGDGDTDAAVMHTLDNVGLPYLTILDNVDGQLEISQTFEHRNAFFDNGFLAADVNDDGALDLVLSWNGPAGIQIHLNDGKGDFSDFASYSLADWTYSVLAADFDLDGDTDLLGAGGSPTPFPLMLLRAEPPPCLIDLTGSSDPNDPTYGVPDGDADSDDFFFYLDAFATGDMNTCDIDQDADCDAEDFFAYLDLFAAGC